MKDARRSAGPRIARRSLILAAFVAASRAVAAPLAWIPTGVGTNTVAVIDIDTDSIVRTVRVGAEPVGVAVSDGGTTVYVTNTADDTVSVIDNTVTLPTVTSTIPVGAHPVGIALDQTPGASPGREPGNQSRGRVRDRHRDERRRAEHRGRR